MANQSDKQQFIFMLSTELEKSNCKALPCTVQNCRRATAKLYHAPGDADLLIVQKSVEYATTSRTVLVEDTDLIVLPCYYVSLDSHYLF